MLTSMVTNRRGRPGGSPPLNPLTARSERIPGSKFQNHGSFEEKPRCHWQDKAYQSKCLWKKHHYRGRSPGQSLWRRKDRASALRSRSWRYEGTGDQPNRSVRSLRGILPWTPRMKSSQHSENFRWRETVTIFRDTLEIRTEDRMIVGSLQWSGTSLPPGEERNT